MKKTILTLSLITFSQLTMAGVFPGSQVLHKLSCTSNIIPTVGVQMGLNITTQALAPEYNVKAIALTTKPIAPQAQTTIIPLNQFEQTAYNATFGMRGVKVELDKDTFTASLVLGAMEYYCK